jgi:hypothetical protein
MLLLLLLDECTAFAPCVSTKPCNVQLFEYALALAAGTPLAATTNPANPGVTCLCLLLDLLSTLLLLFVLGSIKTGSNLIVSCHKGLVQV